MPIMTMTNTAEDKIKELCTSNNKWAVRLGIKGGGCAGFEYEWGTAEVSEIEADDFSVECDAGVFVVRSYALVFLAGSEIDYVKSIIGQQFEIKNPNAQSSCGCGVSVNFDMDKLSQPAI